MILEGLSLVIPTTWPPEGPFLLYGFDRHGTITQLRVPLNQLSTNSQSSFLWPPIVSIPLLSLPLPVGSESVYEW